MAMSLGDVQFDQTQLSVHNHHKTLRITNKIKPAVTEEGGRALAAEPGSDRGAAAYIPTRELCE